MARSDALTAAETIRDETTAGANTATRVGQAVRDAAALTGDVISVDTSGGAQAVTLDGTVDQVVTYKNSGGNSLTINAAAGFTFEGGGSNIVSAADGDVVTLSCESDNVIYLINVTNV